MAKSRGLDAKRLVVGAGPRTLPCWPRRRSKHGLLLQNKLSSVGASLWSGADSTLVRELAGLNDHARISLWSWLRSVLHHLFIALQAVFSALKERPFADAGR